MMSAEARELFKRFQDVNDLAIGHQPLDVSRANANRTVELCGVPSGVTRELLTIEGVRTLRLTPDDLAEGRKGILIHGGAFVLMSPESHERFGGYIAALCRAEVYIPDYRLAPEHPFPAALQDCTRVASSFCNDRDDHEHIFLMGESAGGALAVGTIMNLNREKLARPECLILISPWLDLALTGESLTTNVKNDVILSLENLKEYAGLYLNGTSQRDPLASPLYGAPHGFPPTYIQAAEYDLLLDDSIRFAEKLRNYSIFSELDVFPEMQHSFQFFVGTIPEAESAIKKIRAFIEAHVVVNNA